MKTSKLFIINNTVSIYLMLLFCCLLASCSNTDTATDDATFTLRKGVSLENIQELSSDEIKQTIGVTKVPGGYQFTIDAYFSCSEMEPPWITTNEDNKSTLVIIPKLRKIGFSNSAECARSLKIKVIGRLNKGNIVYVLNNHEVIGHLVLP